MLRLECRKVVGLVVALDALKIVGVVVTKHVDPVSLDEDSVELFESTGKWVGEVVAKWGPCHSCNCRGFMSRPQKDNICGTCGHHWEMHY